MLDQARSSLTEVADRAYGRVPWPVRDVITAARDANVLLFAAGLAFYALISVAPAVVVTFWVATAIAGTDRMQTLGENLGELGGGATVESAVEQLAGAGTGVGLGALTVALWPATAYGSGLMQALDHISATPARSAQGVQGRARMLLLIALLPLLLLGALVLSYVVTGLVGDDGIGTVLGWALAFVVGWAATSGVVLVVYRAYGPLDLSLRALAGGAALVAAAMAVMSLGYLLYMGSGTDWEERVAGSGLAAVVLLGLWLYLTNLLLLTGYFVARDADEHLLDRSPAEQGRAAGDRDAERDAVGAGDADAGEPVSSSGRGSER